MHEQGKHYRRNFRFAGLVGSGAMRVDQYVNRSVAVLCGSHATPDPSSSTDSDWPYDQRWNIMDSAEQHSKPVLGEGCEYQGRGARVKQAVQRLNRM